MSNIEHLQQQIKFTVIYYQEDSLELKFDHLCTTNIPDQRIHLDDEYRIGKIIIALCHDHVSFLNKLGDRVLHRKAVILPEYYALES